MKHKTILLSNASRGAIIRAIVLYQQDRKNDYLKFVKGEENNSFKI